jgi:hypothetical protein
MLGLRVRYRSPVGSDSIGFFVSISIVVGEQSADNEFDLKGLKILLIIIVFKTMREEKVDLTHIQFNSYSSINS